jgi:hypothetical protein
MTAARVLIASIGGMVARIRHSGDDDAYPQAQSGVEPTGAERARA